MAGKKALRKAIRVLEGHSIALEDRVAIQSRELAQLRAENNSMKKHWQPIPIAHPWTPSPERCIFCDDPRSHPRHQLTDELTKG